MNGNVNSKMALKNNNMSLSGYMRDAQGRLVPSALIKPIDNERDQLVCNIIKKSKEIQDVLVRFKSEVFGDIEAFSDLSAEQYGVKLGGKKGNISLLSFDGKYKVQRCVHENMEFDERLQSAKALIDECIRDWSEGAKPELMTLINDAFRVDQKGDIRTARVLALRRLDIDDHRWRKAMIAIGEACQVVSSKSYVRFYERIGETEQYKAISLDLASL